MAHILANGVHINGCDACPRQDLPDHDGMALVSSAMANAAAARRSDRSLPIRCGIAFGTCFTNPLRITAAPGKQRLHAACAKCQVPDAGEEGKQY